MEGGGGEGGRKGSERKGKGGGGEDGRKGVKEKNDSFHEVLLHDALHEAGVHAFKERPSR
jgi:hypothetical protein